MTLDLVLRLASGVFAVLWTIKLYTSGRAFDLGYERAIDHALDAIRRNRLHHQRFGDDLKTPEAVLRELQDDAHALQRAKVPR